jgi:hypothetical protein
VCRFNSSTRYLDRVITNYDFTGISSLPENWPLIVKEREEIFEREWKYFQAMQTELNSIKQKYNLLSNSRVLKTYFRLKSLFINHS